MDIMWIAIAVDMMGYTLCGTIIYFLGRRHLPSPWNEPSIIIPFAIAFGALVTMLTFTHWRVYPG
jgi:hypothetical protein